MDFPTVWSLDEIVEGGIEGDSFQQLLDSLSSRVVLAIATSDSLPSISADIIAWRDALMTLVGLGQEATELAIFAHGHAAADTSNRSALMAVGQITDLSTKLERAWVPIGHNIAFCSEDEFGTLCRTEELIEMVPSFERTRRNRKLLMSQDRETLATELARDGIHGWGQLYDRVSGQLTVELDDGSIIGVSQAQNMMGSSDPAARAEAFQGYQKSWKGVEVQTAEVLGHIVGTRQTINDIRGVDEIEDSLSQNHLSRETLDAMMVAIKRARPLLTKYLKAKAAWFGLDALPWQDVNAPLGAGGSQSLKEGVSFVLEHFGSYHPDLRAFAEKALKSGWVETEDRSSKRPGGWCARLPLQRESRIFMTHGGTFSSTVTLAHELGHAFHNEVTKDIHPSKRDIPSTLAETASVFAESLVRDAALKAADSSEVRLEMLDARLRAAVAFLMNIPSRFAFERALYPLRKAGGFDPNTLSSIVVEAQREAYGDALGSWDETFWSSKLHFYISEFGFYNYPYSFGYLFAQLVYTQVLKAGEGGHQQLVELLRRTGYEDAEPLAQATLGVDLTDPETWWLAIAPLERDLEQWLEEAAKATRS